MSYTFLPYSEQQNIRREYRIRVLIVLFFFLSISLIIGVGSLFPAYVYAILEEKNHLNQVAAFKKTADAAAITSTRKQLTESGVTLDSISKTLESDIYSQTITGIVAMKGNVKLNSFIIEHPSPTTVTIVLGGVANTRADLLAFKTRLQGLPGKVAVDLPISTLARDTNISFNLQITQTLP